MKIQMRIYGVEYENRIDRSWVKDQSQSDQKLSKNWDGNWPEQILNLRFTIKIFIIFCIEVYELNLNY